MADKQGGASTRADTFDEATRNRLVETNGIDIITDRVDGLLVKSGDVSGLRDAIAWLGERSGDEKPAPSELGSAEYPPIEPAPGSYVLAD